MKNFLAASLCLLFFSSVFAQSIWIADNRPTAPSGAHLFSTIDAAIAAASPGDIIHVIPSATVYTNATITKDSLSIYGIGYNPQKDQPNKSSIGSLTIGAGRFGVRISGLVITSTLTIGDAAGTSMGNIFIENCDITRINIGDNCCTASSLSNIVIRNCIIGRNFTAGDYMVKLVGNYYTSTSTVITNNVIMGTSSTSLGGYPSIIAQDAIIKNNLFLGNGLNDYGLQLTTSTVSNNIFYGRTAIDNASIGGDISNCTFNNNITFGSQNDALPIGVSGNTGDSTLVRTDPLLVNVPLVDDWDFVYNPSPDVGSPALTAGNDGTDIGLTGSTIPFSTTGTPLPIIKVFRIPEVIKQGDNLNATIEAVGN